MLPAGYRLLDPADPASPLVPVTPASTSRAAALSATSNPVYAPAQVPSSIAVDYAARDRRIESLKQQIDALDDQVRMIRNNPRGCPYWYHYYGSGNGGVNQPALQKYVDQLDQQRNALRREKWQLEGR